MPELTQAQWRQVCLGHGIKLVTGTGHIYKYDGFRDSVSDGYGCHKAMYRSTGIYVLETRNSL